MKITGTEVAGLLDKGGVPLVALQAGETLLVLLGVGLVAFGLLAWVGYLKLGLAVILVFIGSLLVGTLAFRWFEPFRIRRRSDKIDPGGAFALYTSADGHGLWYVPASGDPLLLVTDGDDFVYVP